ncbi:MarR family winged helix-turn-helix transcriptional regulator [Nonomuraea candida]|uniref:MarR family winged helix-turn-helix transcriptional regulator n=1 Tax=Nonomuraea candida TaxID=359159 RepID=UPI000694B17D|nr:MarR family transcriptional regulator [Nonomuraea candida]
MASSAGSQENDGAAEALDAVRELHAAHGALLESVAGRYGLNHNDLRCLEILQREGELRAQRLAGLSNLSPAAITKVVDRLVAAGYAVRRQSATDRRSQVIGLSDGHAELRAATWERVRADAIAVLDDVPDAELRGFVRLLGRLAEVNRAHARRLSAGPPDPATE